MSPFIADSITVAPDGVAGHAIVCASHGGAYFAFRALQLGVCGAVFNDAGMGREGAGMGAAGLFEVIQR